MEPQPRVSECLLRIAQREGLPSLGRKSGEGGEGFANLKPDPHRKRF